MCQAHQLGRQNLHTPLPVLAYQTSCSRNAPTGIIPFLLGRYVECFYQLSKVLNNQTMQILYAPQHASTISLYIGIHKRLQTSVVNLQNIIAIAAMCSEPHSLILLRENIHEVTLRCYTILYNITSNEQYQWQWAHSGQGALSSLAGGTRQFSSAALWKASASTHKKKITEGGKKIFMVASILNSYSKYTSSYHAFFIES